MDRQRKRVQNGVLGTLDGDLQGHFDLLETVA